jgi:hypothetical protein
VWPARGQRYGLTRRTGIRMQTLVTKVPLLMFACFSSRSRVCSYARVRLYKITMRVYVCLVMLQLAANGVCPSRP